jgi:hypothetical protein
MRGFFIASKFDRQRLTGCAGSGDEDGGVSCRHGWADTGKCPGRGVDGIRRDVAADVCHVGELAGGIDGDGFGIEPRHSFANAGEFPGRRIDSGCA